MLVLHCSIIVKHEGVTIQMLNFFLFHIKIYNSRKSFSRKKYFITQFLFYMYFHSSKLLFVGDKILCLYRLHADGSHIYYKTYALIFTFKAVFTCLTSIDYRLYFDWSHCVVYVVSCFPVFVLFSPFI